MKSSRNGMAITGWLLTIGGAGTVLFWLIYEAIGSFANAPVQTTVGVLLVLALLALLVPVPLILATRRANTRRAQAR